MCVCVCVRKVCVSVFVCSGVVHVQGVYVKHTLLNIVTGLARACMYLNKRSPYAYFHSRSSPSTFFCPYTKSPPSSPPSYCRYYPPSYSWTQDQTGYTTCSRHEEGLCISKNWAAKWTKARKEGTQPTTKKVGEIGFLAVKNKCSLQDFKRFFFFSRNEVHMQIAKISFFS